ncbi:MAG: hypothetical protein HY526_07500 [Betaproteobacteria bacterium]|nr:hypothetical protein [Betaproteobacteria bacterium]
MARIRITWRTGEAIADLRDTPASRKLVAALPCEAAANVWGDEVYFSVPLKVPLESDAQQVVDPGTVCFWVEGRSLALPFGPTPISKGDECRLVSKCNVLGRIEGDPRLLKTVREGDTIRVEPLSA